MRCEPFEQWAKVALERAGHEQVKTVRTFAEAGFHKPRGLEITAVDGWTTFVQVVRSSPSGGDVDGWADRPEYRRPDVRVPNPLAPASRPPGRPRPPTLKVRAVETLLRAVLAGDARADVSRVQTYAEAGVKTKPAGVRVSFTDGSTIFCMFVGVAPPGSASPGHPEFEIPKEWL